MNGQPATTSVEEISKENDALSLLINHDLLPLGWIKVKLADWLEENKILMKNGFAYGGFNQNGQGTPHLRPYNVTSDGFIDLSQIKYVENVADDNPYLLQKNDVIFNNTNSENLVGKTSYFSVDGKFVLSNHMTIIRILDNDHINAFWLAMNLQLFWILGVFKAICRRHVGQASISIERLGRLAILCPPFCEQQAIAYVLLTIQQAIQTRRKELELERERKATLMHHLFTHGMRNEPTKQSEVGEIPESWEVLRLGDICTISTGTTPDTNNLSYYQGDIAFVKTSEIANNRIRQIETSISKDAVKKYNLNIYPPGTVFIAMYGQGKTRGQVALLDIPATTSQNTGAIVPKENLQADFLWQLLMSQYDKLRNAGSQGHISHLNLGYVKQYQIPIPPLEEQVELTNIFYRCDAKIMALGKEITLHEELFRALLDELMTGRISTLSLVEQLEKGTLTHGQRTPDGTGTTH